MKFEIAYVSLSGNTEKLAHGIADRLPAGDTIVTDLSCEEISKKADAYLIGFGANKGVVPLKVMEVLDELEGKSILFFVTCGMEPIEGYRAAIETRLRPFLPDGCQYRGMFMCPGRFPDEVLQGMQARLREDPGNKYAQTVIDAAELSAGHPNQADFENAHRFIRERLGL